MVTAQHALQRLKEGNRRFVERVRNHEAALGASPQIHLTQEQQPFAIVLGCSDSRVPAELVFDQGLGDLFVIRVAGNIVAPSLIGSVEFAAEQFGTRLVVADPLDEAAIALFQALQGLLCGDHGRAA